MADGGAAPRPRTVSGGVAVPGAGQRPVFGRRRPRAPARALRFLAAALLLAAALIALPHQAHAQDATLVKNTGQTSAAGEQIVGHSGSNKFTLAQAFTTGANTGGYTVSQVKVLFGSSTDSNARVSIYSASGGEPDTSQFTLTNPASLTANATNTFSVSGTQTLAASTTYFVVLEITDSSGEYRVKRTVSNNEDAGAASGWSIGNVFHRRNRDTADWATDTTNRSLQIDIIGAAASANNAATGAPAVTGVPQVGQALAAAIGTIADADGLPAMFPADYTFQWVRVDGSDETDIPGATSNIYTLVAADEGKTLKVKVDFTDDEDNDESVASDAYPSTGSVLAAQSDCPAAATWCATMTVGTVTLDAGTIYIHQSGYDPGASPPRGSLSPADFSHGGTDYTVSQLLLSFQEHKTTNDISNGRLGLTVTGGSDLPDGTILTVDGRANPLTVGTGSHHATSGREQWSLGNLNNGPDWLDGQKVTVSLDLHPVLSTATVDGTALTLTYDEDLDDTSVPAASAYTVTVDGSAATVSSVAISGAAVTLTLATAVTGGQTVTVSYTAPSSNPVQDESGIDAPALTDEAVTYSGNTPATGAPAVTGVPQVGQTLTAGAGAIADLDGLTTTTFPGDYTFQWIRVDGADETDISGATSSTYAPAAADVGKTLKVKVDFTDDEDNDESRTSAATATVLRMQESCATDRTDADWCAEMTVGVITSGSFTFYGFDAPVGDEYGALTDTAIEYGGATYAVERLRITDSPVAGNDVVSFRLDAFAPRNTVFDFGGTEFTATADHEHSSLTGVYVWGVADDFGWRLEGQKVTVSANLPPLVLVSATVDGTALVLTYDKNLDDTSVPAASAYTVTVDGSAATVSSVAISGAAVTLTLATAVTEGQTVTVSYTVPSSNPVQDASGIDAAALTNEAVRNGGNLPATGAPAITGTPQVGQSLAAGIGTIADDDGLPATFPDDYTFQWIRVDGTDETDISGATSRTYTPVAADVGKTLKVKVDFTDDGGNDESRTSAATAAVVRMQESCATDRTEADWCAEMTVGVLAQGVQTVYGFDAPGGDEYGALTDTTIEYGGATYTVRILRVSDSPVSGVDRVRISLDAFVPRNTVFDLGGTEFTATAANEQSNVGHYQQTVADDFGWRLEGQKVTVSANLPPGLVSARVDGTALVLTYAEDLDDTSVPAASAYTVTVAGSAVTVSSVAVSGAAVTLTLAAAVTAGQTVTVSYTVPSSNPVQDESGLDAAALTDEPVTSGAAVAQPTVGLVSNTGQTALSDFRIVGYSGSSKITQAQAFTTGGNARGYTLSQVKAHLGAFAHDNAQVSIYSAAGGEPDASLFTLTNPASVDANAINTFSVSGTQTLAARTTYFVVFEIAGSSGDYDVRHTNSNNEDAGKASGWSIGDGLLWRNSDTGNWRTETSSLLIDIVGAAIISADATLSALSIENPADRTAISFNEAFASGTTRYSASVANSVRRITVKPTTNNSYATVAYLDAFDSPLADADSAKAGRQVALSVGSNTVKVKVTAEDGNTVRIYTIAVARAVAPQPTVSLVSTLRQGRAEDDYVGTDGTVVNVLAQQFTTGDHPTDYTLTEVVAALDYVGNSDTRPKVSVYTDASGTPGSSLHVLTGPASLTANANNTFTAPGQCDARREHQVLGRVREREHDRRFGPLQRNEYVVRQRGFGQLERMEHFQYL